MGSPVNINQRIFLIVILFIYITTMYTLEGIFIAGQTNYESAINETDSFTQILEGNQEELQNPENYSYEQMQVKSNPLDVIIGFFAFLGFAPFGLPPAFQTIILTSVIMCFIVLGMLVYAFIRDWIPLV